MEISRISLTLQAAGMPERQELFIVIDLRAVTQRNMARQSRNQIFSAKTQSYKGAKQSRSIGYGPGRPRGFHGFDKIRYGPLRPLPLCAFALECVRLLVTGQKIAIHCFALCCSVPAP